MFLANLTFCDRYPDAEHSNVLDIWHTVKTGQILIKVALKILQRRGSSHMTLKTTNSILHILQTRKGTSSNLEKH